MMALGEQFAVICLDSIDDKAERKNVVQYLRETGKEVIAITEAQVNCFAGNMLQVVGKDDKRITVMSKAAFESLTKEQISTIAKSSTILYSDLHTIETAGGGSAGV